MAAQLAIAKASFAASLFKPDPALPSALRDDIEQYHGLLSAAVAQCSPTNVQKCKQWILQHLVPSPARLAALGKYLVALVNSFTTAEQVSASTSRQSREPSMKRKRLHVLYVLNDVFFHVKFRIQEDAIFNQIAPHLPAVVRSAASFTNCPRHIKKLEDLISLWEEKGYFASTVLEKLRAAITAGPSPKDSIINGTSGTQQATSTLSKETPYLLPSVHGDVSTPWYDLPAGNWLPFIEPNSTRPMNPDMIRPLQLAGGPADRKLAEAVKNLLVDVDKIYDKDLRLDGDSTVDISQMGELIERDEINGEIIGGETYYGWSRAFCEKMKARRKKGISKDSDGSRRGRRTSPRSSSRSRSLSRGRSSSGGSGLPAFKRRRISPSQSRSRNRTSSKRDENRSRSLSRRSYSPQRSPTYSRSRSRSRSRSPPSGLGNHRERERSRPRYSPPAPAPPPAGPPAPVPVPNYDNVGYNNGYNPPRPQYNQPSFPLPPPPPQAGGPGFGAWNVPPPPPPQYQGQWPPPPPPPPSSSPPPGWFPPGGQPNTMPAMPTPGQWSGSWVQPPPPPPQQNQQNNFQYGGRGGGNNGGYRGRGGYSRGRGW